MPVSGMGKYRNFGESSLIEQLMGFMLIEISTHIHDKIMKMS
jgi:hypothetical protein